MSQPTTSSPAAALASALMAFIYDVAQIIAEFAGDDTASRLGLLWSMRKRGMSLELELGTFLRVRAKTYAQHRRYLGLLGKHLSSCLQDTTLKGLRSQPQPVHYHTYLGGKSEWDLNTIARGENHYGYSTADAPKLLSLNAKYYTFPKLVAEPGRCNRPAIADGLCKSRCRDVLLMSRGILNYDGFHERLLARWPKLPEINALLTSYRNSYGEGIVIAGSAVLHALQWSPLSWEPGDIDIFTRANAINRLAPELSRIIGAPPVFWSRGVNIGPYQFIAHTEMHPWDILRTFDIDICAMSYTFVGRGFYMSADGLVSLMHGVFRPVAGAGDEVAPVESPWSKIRTSRVQKYRARGYEPYAYDLPENHRYESGREDPIQGPRGPVSMVMLEFTRNSQLQY